MPNVGTVSEHFVSLWARFLPSGTTLENLQAFHSTEFFSIRDELLSHMQGEAEKNLNEETLSLLERSRIERESSTVAEAIANVLASNVAAPADLQELLANQDLLMTQLDQLTMLETSRLTDGNNSFEANRIFTELLQWMGTAAALEEAGVAENDPLKIEAKVFFHCTLFFSR